MNNVKLWTLLLLILLSPLASAENIEFEEYNKLISEAGRAGEEWARSPLMVVLGIVGDRHEVANRTIQLRSVPESFDSVSVRVTEEGLMDDSIRGIRHEIQLVKEAGGYWRIISAKKLIRCWPGRGADDYTEKPCL